MTTSWPTSTEGTIPFIVDGETYQTYYRVFGDLKNASKLPLIVCHGGPGLTHDYLLPLSDLSLSEDSRPVIFYDQLGNGRSTHIHDKPSIWSFDLFIDELVNLIKFFEFQEYDILGHSWGGVLLSEFEVRRQPKGLKHAILSSSLAASALWGRSTMELLSAFPKEVQESVSVGMKDPKRFREGLAPFHAAHGNTVKPLPKEYFDSLYAAIGDDGDPTVSQGMKMGNWSVIDKLHQVTVPTLVIHGRADIAQDYVVAPFFENLPKCKWITMEKCSHMPFWEDRAQFMKYVEQFLQLKF